MCLLDRNESIEHRQAIASCKLQTANCLLLSANLQFAICILQFAIPVFAGCVQEMSNQPRVEPLEASAFFDDGRASRHPVENTVARGQLQLETAFYTGKEAGELVTELPPEALAEHSMAELLERGQGRFGVFCSHCHGAVGGGVGGSEAMREMVGMVVKRGFPVPPTYHQDRLRDAPIGHFFDVITSGLGRMPAHGYLIPAGDRWAIAAYIRALQLSQHAKAQQLAPEDLDELQSQVEAE
jgi:mono/diheme cytochrome c family protein